MTKAAKGTRERTKGEAIPAHESIEERELHSREAIQTMQCDSITKLSAMLSHTTPPDPGHVLVLHSIRRSLRPSGAAADRMAVWSDLSSILGSAPFHGAVGRL